MWEKMLINTLPMGIVLYCLNVNPILMEKCPTAKFTQKHTPNQKKNNIFSIENCKVL